MKKSSLTVEEIQKAFWAAVKKTINKFREHPYYFFTESDIVSYFYYCLYNSSFEIPDKKGKRIYLAHREYPTNFRYDKKKLLDETFNKPYELKSKNGTRGNYDFALLNPEFVKMAETVEDVVNKNIKLLLKRTEGKGRELLFSVEFKYVINNNKNFVAEILMDNKKLLFSEENQSNCGINLVFCNKADPFYGDKIENAVKNSKVISIFIHSYYDTGNKKITPKPKASPKLKRYISENKDMFEKSFWDSLE